MAKERGWWDLDLHDQRMEDLTYTDREHVAQCIIGGNTGGEIVKDENDNSDDEETYPDNDQVEISIRPKVIE